jgi:hypothetical protein
MTIPFSAAMSFAGYARSSGANERVSVSGFAARRPRQQQVSVAGTGYGRKTAVNPRRPVVRAPRREPGRDG